MKNQATTSKRLWNHKSVRALMHSNGSDDPEMIVREKARELVRYGKSKGWSGPPFDPLLLASIRGIKHRQSDSLFTADAQLVPIDGNQLLLEFNPRRPSGRRNYTIGHEISHTFFDDCYEMVHQRSTERKAFDPQEEVEHLCQVGASEIVMPSDEFLREMGSLPKSLRSVFPLCEKFDVSREACARRFLDLSGIHGALVFLSKRNKPAELKECDEIGTFPETKYRVLYSVCSQGFDTYIPRHKSVSDDSCIYNLHSLDVVESGDENWNIKGLGVCSVEAMRLPMPYTEEVSLENPTTMALIRPF